MNFDLISLVNEVVREKHVHEDDVFYALEHALLNLAKDRYGSSGELLVNLDRKTGNIVLCHNCVVVKDNPDHTQISLDKALLIDANAVIDSKVPVQLPFDDFSRIGAHTSINLLYKKLEELRRVREYSEFSTMTGEIVSCIVKQTFYDGQIVVTVGRGIGVIQRNDLLPTEIGKYKPGDHVKAYIKEVTQNHTYQIQLSRTHNQFVAKLFALQVPEIASGDVIIKKVVREPGRRAKVAVATENTSIDPVKMCVGQAGKRIAPIMEELKGERIDIIPWTDNLVSYTVNALKPAEVQQVIFRENNLILIVPDEQKKRAIGEHGNNVKLAAALTGANLSILTVSESGERKQELQKFFEIALDVDDSISQALVDKGFETIHDLNSTTSESLATTVGMDEELAAALKERAQAYTHETREFLQNTTDLDKALLEIPGLKTPYIKVLIEHNIKKVLQLAMITPEQLMEWLSDYKITLLSAQRFITYAKKKSGKFNMIKGNPNRPDLSNKHANEGQFGKAREKSGAANPFRKDRPTYNNDRN